MSKANADIRELMLQRGVKQADIVRALGRDKGSVSRSLRVEMSPSKKYFYGLIIEDIAKNKEIVDADKPNRDIYIRLAQNGLTTTGLSKFMGYSSATIPHKLKKCELKEWDKVAINAAIDAMIAEGEKE